VETRDLVVPVDVDKTESSFVLLCQCHASVPTMLLVDRVAYANASPIIWFTDIIALR